ncbi:MAG: paraquat-inducible protein A [Gammaproteobacteria bacterium]|nr:paraquat-inducible protein A [Gammaproteobacteria bacterium]
MSLLDTLRRIYPFVFYPCALSLAFIIATASLEADRFMRAAVQQQDAATSAERAAKQALETLTFSLYDGARALRQEQASMEFAVALHARQARNAAWALGSLTIVLLLALPRQRRQWLGHLTALGLVCFGIGVTASLLRVVTYADVPVLGQVAVGFTAKTLVSTIDSLWQEGHETVAGLVFLFSFVTPLAKLAVTAACLIFDGSRRRDQALRLVHFIGKWSMVDVFIVAVLLVVFSFKGDAVGHATPGIGLSFFAAYCVIAQAVLLGLDRRAG